MGSLAQRAKMVAALRNHPQFSAYVALACVCLLWGTTYLGIRIAVEQLAPATLMCVRYTLSGVLILIASRIKGARLPRGRELWGIAGCGVLTIGLGTGTLTFAEVWVPSGLASLFVTTASFWLVGAEALMPGGEPLHAPTIGAMLIGAAGAAMLVTPDRSDLAAPAGRMLAGFALIQLGYVGWGFGSVLQRRLKSKTNPIVSAGVQQLATGLAFVPLALFSPPSHWTARSVGAMLYLAIFGGAIGYSAYVIAVTKLPVPIASIYSYVNPLVAVILGVWLYGERFTWREAVAMIVIFVGIALVKEAQSRRTAKRQVHKTGA